MLSDLMARQAKSTGKPYSLADFDGLYLYVSAIGTKAWHFRYSSFGKRERITLSNHPALSLKDARALRDEARTLLAKGVNPHSARKHKWHAIILAGEHTFMAVYEQWLAHRRLSLEEGRQTSLEQILDHPGGQAQAAQAADQEEAQASHRHPALHPSAPPSP